MRPKTITLLAALVVFGAAAANPPLDLSWNTVDGGGGDSSGGTFLLRGTLGQCDAGVLAGGTYELNGGFWIPSAGGAPPCPADLDGNGDVGFTDLLAILSAWGPCPPDCPGDLDGSGDVGFADLLEVLSAWGPCP